MTKEEIIQGLFAMMVELACKPKQDIPHLQPSGEATCLLLLNLHGGDALPGELAEGAGVTTARIAVTLKQMESKGYVLRQPNPRDRRQIRAELTEAGWEASRREEARLRDNWSNLIDILGEEDAEHGLRILRKLVDNISANGCRGWNISEE